MRYRLLLLAVLLFGCRSGPVGPEPKQLCTKEQMIVGESLNIDSCVSIYTQLREEKPKRYLCYAACVDKGGNAQALRACHQICRQIDE